MTTTTTSYRERKNYLYDSVFCYAITEYDDNFRAAITEDDNDLFISTMELLRDSYGPKAQSVLDDVCTYPAIKCAEALITGKTPLKVDLNLPCCPHNTGMLPLHRVTYLCPNDPAMTELLLYYGARTDIRFSLLDNYHQQGAEEVEKLKRFVDMLPLQMALQGILAEFFPFLEWTPKQSVYKLITMLCLPSLQNRLETIALLAGTTNEFEEVFLEYAMDGKFVELACLLVAAPREKLHDVMDRVQQYCHTFSGLNITTLSIDENQREKLTCLQQLLEVFDKAGDRISAYVKENKINVSNGQTIVDVKKILSETGFYLTESEVDFHDSRYCSTEDMFSFKKGTCSETRRLEDFGMAHYSKSGYRWNVSGKDGWLDMLDHEAYINELEREVKCLKEENANLEKKQQQLNLQVWMDDELQSALEKDDKEEFLSVINHNLTFFRSRQQQILYSVCCSGSIKCAEALIKGETSLTVDLNIPCTDTGLYPLHCAGLCFFPSITELFLYHGAQTETRFIPLNPSDVFPQHLLKVHANKLPLQMALHGISRLPCIREWNFRHSISKLAALLCLPRMQNSLETLGLLAMTTKETEEVFLQLAKDGEFVGLTALLITAYTKLRKTMFQARDQYWSMNPMDEEQREINKSGQLLCQLFVELGDDMAAYVKEDKYDVSKYRVMEDVASMIRENGLLMPLDVDFSVYDWYRNEESSYPLKAPYEYTRRSPDTGMEHYSKSSFRWRGLKKQFKWRKEDRLAYRYELETEKWLVECQYEDAKYRLQKETKPTVLGVPYVFRWGVPIASSNFFSNKILDVDTENKRNTSSSNYLPIRAKSSLPALSNLQNFHSNKSKLALASRLVRKIPH